MQLSLQLIANELKKTYPDVKFHETSAFHIQKMAPFSPKTDTFSPAILYCATPPIAPSPKLSEIAFLFIGDAPDTAAFKNYIWLPATTDIYQCYADVQEILLKIWGWNARVLEISTSSLDFSELLKECKEIFPVPLYYYSLYHNVFFYSDTANIYDEEIFENYFQSFYEPDLQILADTFQFLNETHFSSDSSYIYLDYDNRHRLIENVFVDHMRIGSLCLMVENDASKELYDPYLKVLTSCISTMFRRMFRKDDISAQKTLTDLFNGEYSSDPNAKSGKKQKRFSESGSSYRILVLHPQKEHAKIFFSEQLLYSNLLKRLLNTDLIFFHEGNLIALRDYSGSSTLEEDDKNHQRLQYFSKKIGAFIGISLPFSYLNEFKIFFEQAKAIALTEKKPDKTYAVPGVSQSSWAPIHDYSYYLLFDMIRNFSISHPLNHYIHPDIQVLAMHDEEGKNNLMFSLYLYLLNDKSYQICAGKEIVHRNTFAYRIKKALTYIKCDINDENIRLSLLLSICMYWYLHPKIDPVGISMWKKIK